MTTTETPTTPGTTPGTTTPGTSTSTQAATKLLTDVKGTVTAIENGDWLAAGLSLTNAAMDIINMGSNPLGAIISAGFGWAIEHISFLKEPFDALLGKAESITGGAQSWLNAATKMTTTAQQYRTAATNETTNWLGQAADSYRTASASHADGLESLGQVGTGISKAISGAGDVLAQVRKMVLDFITEAVQKIIMQIIQALSTSWATFGASIAAAIVQIVQTAASAAQKIFGKIQKFVSSLQKIIQLIQKVLQIAKAVKALIEQISGKASTPPATSATTLPATADLGLTSGSLTNMDTVANANYANSGILNPTPIANQAPTDFNYTGFTPGQVSTLPAPATDTGLTQVAQAPQVLPATETPPAAQTQTRPLPAGVPSWGPTGPPPDAGRAASRTQLNQWIEQARNVLIAEGVDPAKMNAAQIAGLIGHESSNNPHAINLWDSNATAGHPSKGLMQTIDSTFTTYHLPGYDNIYAPVDNIIAGTRYAIARYGSISRVPGVRATESGGSYVGY